MEVTSLKDKISNLRKCLLILFSFFSCVCLMQFMVLDEINILAISPIILYFIISLSLIAPICLFSKEHILKHLPDYLMLIILYSIYVFYNFILSSVFISIEKPYDANFMLSFLMLFFLFLGLLAGKFFTKKRDNTSFEKEAIIRGNEIELRKFNPWADLSLDKAPWLRKPLKGLHYAVAIFILLIGGSAAGLSIAIAEGLRRSGILGDEINTYAFLFFIMGVPIGIAIGVVIAPLLSYLYHWRKLLKTVKKEHGSYTVLLNLEKKPYSELKQGLSEG
ncbi:hypothetical protein F0225_06045 [Vibrio pectenicida]|uniref:Uncharacterized protein n=1 Tax=Vibrio pectenicida TaxID=62763 RepID=A0A7Y3ZXU8_9VIBR|nr:hypothetical protein [Vibrio pectenicida]NOH70903.1 hypothetical protein [Vibrio pectenicida]